MRLIASLLGIKRKTKDIFDQTNGKTLEEYRQELLLKIAKKQFEKLQNLGLAIPVRLA